MPSTSFSRASCICAAALITGGISSCVGRWLGIQWLIDPVPGDRVLPPLAAVTFVLIGLFLLRLRACSSPNSLELRAAGVVLIALFVITKILSGDTFYNFCLLGCAFLCLSSSYSRIKGWAHALIIVSISVALASIISYTYGLDDLKFLRLSAGFHAENALLTLLASIALLCLFPRHGVLKILVSTTTAGKMARSLLPFVLLMPFLGLLNGPQRNDPRDLLLVLTLILCGLPTLILTVGSYLEKAELEREALYVDMQKLSQRLSRQLADLEESGEKLHQALQIRNHLIARINHELRTPLHGILGATQLLLARDFLPSDRDLIVAADQSANHLLAVVSDMLTIADIEKGRLIVDLHQCDVRGLAAACIQSLNWLAQRKNVKLSLVFCDELPTSIVTDEVLLERVIRNLVDNAIKFTEQGEVTVCLSMSSPNSKPCLHLSVKDTGPGMSRQLLERSFEASDSAFNRPHSGMGFGLIAVTKIVELLDGELQIDGRQGAGTEITINLPAMPKHDGVATVTNCESAVRVCRPAEGHVLVAEDNAVNAKIMQLCLKKLGVDSTVVDDGRQAVNAVATGTYDLVLMDVQMPQMDGLEATAEIRKLACKSAAVPIIGVTAHATDEDRRACLDAGMNDFLTKPVGLPCLQTALLKWLAVSISTNDQLPHENEQRNIDAVSAA
jgi:signal transduction histidine kinase/CheY-like chemotaxis protein